MKKLIAGIVIGMVLAGGTQLAAEWGFEDIAVLREALAEFKGYRADRARAHKEMLEVEQWKARSLQRIVWALERAFPAPPEAK